MEEPEISLSNEGDINQIMFSTTVPNSLMDPKIDLMSRNPTFIWISKKQRIKKANQTTLCKIRILFSEAFVSVMPIYEYKGHNINAFLALHHS